MAYKTWNVGDVLTSADMNTYVRDANTTICTSGTRPTGIVEGKEIYETDTDRVYRYDGSNWQLVADLGGWDSYTPTWGAVTTPPALGNGTITGKYKLLPGKTCMVQVKLTTGSTSTYGSGNYTFSLPPEAATMVETTSVFPLGVCIVQDASPVARYAGVVEVQSSTLVAFLMSGTGTAATPTVPMTWASGDTLYATWTYEYV